MPYPLESYHRLPYSSGYRSVPYCIINRSPFQTLHRIRRHLLMLMLLMLHSASAADFSKCGGKEKKVVRIRDIRGHSTCSLEPYICTWTNVLFLGLLGPRQVLYKYWRWSVRYLVRRNCQKWLQAVFHNRVSGWNWVIVLKCVYSGWSALRRCRLNFETIHSIKLLGPELILDWKKYSHAKIIKPLHLKQVCIPKQLIISIAFI